MATTEEKITSVEKIVKSSEELGDSDLIEQANSRLKELHEQLKQEHSVINA